MGYKLYDLKINGSEVKRRLEMLSDIVGDDKAASQKDLENQINKAINNKNGTAYIDAGQVMELVTIITFTIDGVSYEAVKDMTWGLWCDSGYNPGKYGIGDDNKIYTDNGILFDDQKGRQCLLVDAIVDGGRYEEY